MRTLHDIFVAACERKIAYEDPAAAEAVAERLTRQSPYGELLRVYRCPFAPLGAGGHFHIGHVRGTKPKPKVLRAKQRWSPPRLDAIGSTEGLMQLKIARSRRRGGTRRPAQKLRT